MDPFDPKMTLKKKEEEKGEGEGGMKQGWCGQAARKPLTMGGLVPPRDGGGEGTGCGFTTPSVTRI